MGLLLWYKRWNMQGQGSSNTRPTCSEPDFDRSIAASSKTAASASGLITWTALSTSAASSQPIDSHMNSGSGVTRPRRQLSDSISFEQEQDLQLAFPSMTMRVSSRTPVESSMQTFCSHIKLKRCSTLSKAATTREWHVLTWLRYLLAGLPTVRLHDVDCRL